jgi:hypothetical protein
MQFLQNRWRLLSLFYYLFLFNEGNGYQNKNYFETLVSIFFIEQDITGKHQDELRLLECYLVQIMYEIPIHGIAVVAEIICWCDLRLYINKKISGQYINTLSWIFIVPAHWNNSPQIEMSFHSDTLSWFRAKTWK